MTLNEENDYSPDAEKPRPRRTPEGSGPGRGGMSPKQKKGP